jgi:hypothetical protein
MENGRFLLPEAVAAQLTAEGYIRSAEEELGKADVGMIVLTVYNTASATVTLFQTPGVIRALAASLRRWFRREKDAKPDYQFEMTARGRSGTSTSSLMRRRARMRLCSFSRRTCGATPPRRTLKATTLHRRKLKATPRRKSKATESVQHLAGVSNDHGDLIAFLLVRQGVEVGLSV